MKIDRQHRIDSESQKSMQLSGDFATFPAKRNDPEKMQTCPGPTAAKPGRHVNLGKTARLYRPVLQGIAVFLALLILCSDRFLANTTQANQQPVQPPANSAPENTASQQATAGSSPSDLPDPDRYSKLSAEQLQQRAERQLSELIVRIANGPGFRCDLWQRVRTQQESKEREILCLGSYLHQGQGTARFEMHTQIAGRREDLLRQVSDGRLLWTSQMIAGKLNLSRVDLGLLDDRYRSKGKPVESMPNVGHPVEIRPSMLTGGLCEILDTMRRDYDLSLGTSDANGQDLMVIIGNLKDSKREAIISQPGGKLPPSYPTRINVAVALQNDQPTGFGKGLPVQIEHFGTPPEDDDQDATTSRRNMISLLQLNNLQPLKAAPLNDRFKFDSGDNEFISETPRYETRFQLR
ncbi:MAG: hypothetical protein CBB71_21840 [Rhodopirellula sp. TMED11]|nr:MAG: hypothetical protein CBB71_21840 [Rhodopirellula sp. TMED11]